MLVAVEVFALFASDRREPTLHHRVVMAIAVTTHRLRQPVSVQSRGRHRWGRCCPGRSGVAPRCILRLSSTSITASSSALALSAVSDRLFTLWALDKARQRRCQEAGLRPAMKTVLVSLTNRRHDALVTEGLALPDEVPGGPWIAVAVAALCVGGPNQGE